MYIIFEMASETDVFLSVKQFQQISTDSSNRKDLQMTLLYKGSTRTNGKCGIRNRSNCSLLPNVLYPHFISAASRSLLQAPRHLLFVGVVVFILLLLLFKIVSRTKNTSRNCLDKRRNKIKISFGLFSEAKRYSSLSRLSYAVPPTLLHLH